MVTLKNPERERETGERERERIFLELCDERSIFKARCMRTHLHAIRYDVSRKYFSSRGRVNNTFNFLDSFAHEKLPVALCSLKRRYTPYVVQ
ncbi:hypothetical protein PUN28_000113 [Cardiocondyla obscurior]|uniref:Uncharacterized protein n=1 Tax=Cardiocondyla obscurior TaxID=286306 RepID=A0AAW2GXX9_9HYME